jgi:hypothetical protein
MTLIAALSPLRRSAGERKGPIAQQWEGEVAPDTKAMPVERSKTHLSLPASRVPSLSPRYAGGEGVLDKMS